MHTAHCSLLTALPIQGASSLLGDASDLAMHIAYEAVHLCQPRIACSPGPRCTRSFICMQSSRGSAQLARRATRHFDLDQIWKASDLLRMFCSGAS